MKNLHFLFNKFQKTKNFLCIPIIFLTLLTVHSQIIENPYDSNGWSILNPENTSKILYVSSSGDDTTGEVYSNTATEIGSNPILPAGAINPFRTIAAAVNQISNGEAAWILLKRGDVFYERLRNIKNGNSLTRPIVYASYGPGSQPPLLKTGANNGISACCLGTQHVWFIGLSFYAHTRNPDDIDFVNYDGGDGINFFTANNQTTENILIEGCTFNFYRSNVIQGYRMGTIKNIRVRRNIIRNNYGTIVNGDIKHSQGFFTSNIKGGILLEENIFDHNGWFSKAGGSDDAVRQATIFNHHTYFYHTENAIFRGNAFHRPSSIGNKWANTETGDAANITIKDNFYNDCEVAISMGGNDATNPHRFKDITIKDNIITSPGLSQPTNRTLGWNIGINDWDNGEVTKNLIIHQTSPSVDNGRGISITGENRNLTVSENILYNLGGTEGIRMSTLVSNTNVSVTNNELTAPTSLNSGFMVNMYDGNYTSLMSNNAYELQDDTANNFNVSGTRYSLNDWMSETGATNTITTVYPDPSRSFDRYVSEVLGLANRNEYYQNLANINYLNWNTAYTASAINKWIKEGFYGDGTLSTPDDELNASTIQTYPNPGTGILKVKSSIEGNYQVHNQLGQIILSEKFNQYNEIDLTRQAAGLYLINFYDQSKNKIKTFKYLKR